MRRVATGLGLVVLMAAMAGLLAGSASAGGSKKLVEGTVYDTTCAAACVPECPPIPCGPVTQGQRAKVICAQQAARLIVCPLAKRAVVCVKAPCPATSYPVYSGEGATVNVRKRGSATVIARLPVVEGHFKIRLGPGEYVFRPYLPEEGCWPVEPVTTKVPAWWKGPFPLPIDVHDTCVAYPGTTN